MRGSLFVFIIARKRDFVNSQTIYAEGFMRFQGVEKNRFVQILRSAQDDSRFVVILSGAKDLFRFLFENNRRWA